MILKLSPAKVNLHLSVLRKRPDGYHDIATLMQAISLYDELEFSPLPSGIVINCPGSDLPEDEGNIVYRAAKTFLSRLSSPTGIGITISKKIPLAAGLGGGSSNAATTLMTLNEMTGGRCSKAELMEMGRELGADVPFFIFGQAAWAEGIGDRLQEASGLPRFWFLLLNPGFPVSTKMVYENLNLGLTKEEINYSMRRFEIEPGSNRIEGLHNDLEEVTLTLHPSLRRLKEFLLSCGASGALLSGSGPTIFGAIAT
ncbi:MAG: 4-(cytidine 5'-diphospho)-2-C-methyl-D-erythritol kinase, partial [Syntrophales bacterium LBB04]|nr:4-(cytidine 5'-diphospho)-2-C-methyl-D-erythritol kinase [Syntrophales bacterium LBB04]